MNSWHALAGHKHLQYAGTGAGTVTVQTGASIILIAAQGGAGTMTVFGGPTITLPSGNTAPTTFQFPHTLLQASASANTVVFTGTISMYYIEAILAGNGN